MRHLPHMLSALTLSMLVLTSLGCDLVRQISIQPLLEPTPKETAVTPWAQAAISAQEKVPGHTQELLAIHAPKSWSKQIVTLGSDGLVLAWSLDSPGARVMNRFEARPIVGAFGDTQALVAYATPTEIFVHCLAGCTKTWKLSRLKARATSLAFHGNDRTILIGGSDGRVYRWRFLDEETATSHSDREKCLERYMAHQAIVTTVAPHPFNRVFFSADIRGGFLAWLPYTADDYGGKYDRSPFGGQYFSAPGTYLQAPRPADRGIVSVAVSEDGNRLAMGTEDGFVELWDIRGLKATARSQLHEGRVHSVALNYDGKIAASGGRDGKVVVVRADPDPKFGISPTATKELMIASRAFPLPDVRKVIFMESQQVVASTKDGTLAAITVDELPALPTPAPTESVEGPVDTDY